MNGRAAEPLKRGNAAAMKFRFRQLVLGACSAFLVACATEVSTQVERMEPAPRLPVRPLLLLHASDDARLRDELEETFERFLRNAVDEELALLATCEVECVTSRKLVELGLDPEGAQVVLFEPGEPAVVLIRGRIPQPVGASAPSVLAANDGKPVSARERLARHSRVSTEFLAQHLARALGPGSAASARGCARELALFDENMTGTGAFASEVPFDWRAQSAPFHLALQATHDAEARSALAQYARERWYWGELKGSRWVDTLAYPNCYGIPNWVDECHLSQRETNRFGQALCLLSEAELESILPRPSDPDEEQR
jgi:hypothetical protein